MHSRTSALKTVGKELPVIYSWTIDICFEAIVCSGSIGEACVHAWINLKIFVTPVCSNGQVCGERLIHLAYSEYLILFQSKGKFMEKFLEIDITNMMTQMNTNWFYFP